MNGPSDTNTNFENDAQAIVAAVERLGDTTEYTLKSDDGVQATVIAAPHGKSLLSVKKLLDEYRTKPERRRGTATLTTEDSFVNHVNRFKGDASVVFANVTDPKKPFLLCVLDYNPPGGINTDTAFGTHRAQYPYPVSEEWAAWREKDEKEMEALGFARFIEDRLRDVIAIDPATEAADSPVLREASLVGGTFASPARLLDLSRSLEINSAVAVRQALRLQSGEINVQFVEQHNDNEGKPISIPSLFVIQIPVFDDGVAYRIVCRLRYRLGGGKVTWAYSMVRPDAYFDDAVRDSVERVADGTKLPVLYGKPEE